MSILGSTDPTNVQEHMLKLYDNVLALRFGTGRNSHVYTFLSSSIRSPFGLPILTLSPQMVTGMTSAEGEYIDFKQPISAEGNYYPIYFFFVF